MLDFDIVILACQRPVLLRNVVSAVRRVFPAHKSRVEVWVDAPFTSNVIKHKSKKRADPHKEVVSYVRRLETAHAFNWRAIYFERHVGIRGLWLTVLSIRRTQLVLEDDVVVLPGAYEWVKFALRTMKTRRDIFSASLSKQTTIAATSSRRKLINVTSPFTYPLVGSHGFLMTKHSRDEFVRYRDDRSPCDLLIDGLITSRWYLDLVKQKQVLERMWTAEAVAYAFHRKRLVLYPPTACPLSLHCAADHAVDKVAKQCNGSALVSKTRCSSVVLNYSAPLQAIDWAAEPYNRSQHASAPWRPPRKSDRRMRCPPPPPPSPPPSPAQPRWTLVLIGLAILYAGLQHGGAREAVVVQPHRNAAQRPVTRREGKNRS